MPNTIEKLLFEELSLDGSNYSSWILDVEAHLASKGLAETFEDDTPGLQQRAQALILVRHHLADSLKKHYKTEANTCRLWDELKSRFDHTKLVQLPAARHTWIHLRVQDFKSIADYNSELFQIASDSKLCRHTVNDEEQIEKTLSTFHSTNMVVSTQYCNMKFTRYSELLSHMLQAENIT
jgi:hypothetical protein